MIEKIQANNNFNISTGRLNYLGGNSLNDNIKQLNKMLESGIVFTPGINIIIGENGSGKTTILNLIRYLCFCKKSFEPDLNISSLHSRFEPENNEQLYKNINLIADYNMPIFNLFQMSNEPTVDEGMAFKNKDSTIQFMDLTSKSRGQNVMGDISQLMHIMFDKNTYALVANLVNQFNKQARESGIFLDIVDLVENYYKNNNKSNNKCTILMDEPDQGLDINNLQDLFEMISYDKPDTQLIAVIHNPILIYKLSKLDYINFIELSDNYLNKIKNFLKI